MTMLLCCLFALCRYCLGLTDSTTCTCTRSDSKRYRERFLSYFYWDMTHYWTVVLFVLFGLSTSRFSSHLLPLLLSTRTHGGTVMTDELLNFNNDAILLIQFREKNVVWEKLAKMELSFSAPCSMAVCLRFSRRRRRSSLAARSFHPNGDTREQEVSCVWDEQLHDLPLNLEAEHYAKIEKKKKKKTSWRLVDVLWGEKLMFVGIIVKSFLTFWLIKCLKSYKRDEKKRRKVQLFWFVWCIRRPRTKPICIAHADGMRKFDSRRPERERCVNHRT